MGRMLFDKKDMHGPDSNEIKKYVYEIDGKFYKFTTEICFHPL